MTIHAFASFLARASLALGVTFAVGCASTESSSDEEMSDELASQETEVAPQGYTVNLNCAKGLPGLPPNPCKPDLVFGQQIVQIWKPNNPQNLSPGRYIHFSFTNDSDKPTGPFTVRISDHMGWIHNVVPFTGLAPHESATVIEQAPYQCGWSRTAKLDFNDTVDEYNENDNARTYSFWCPRIPGLELP